MAKIRKSPKIEGTDVSLEERELFLNAFFQGDTSLNDKYNPQDKPQVPKEQPDQYALEPSERELFLRAINEEIREKTDLRKEPSLRKPQPSRAKRAKLVDAEIDLHGMRVDDAIFTLERFIDQEQRRGSRTILVIHGLGTGILKKAVWATVDTHSLVDDFQIASGKLGGQGAIILRINRKSRRK